jgi:hypothetical protein
MSCCGCVELKLELRLWGVVEHSTTATRESSAQTVHSVCVMTWTMTPQRWAVGRALGILTERCHSIGNEALFGCIGTKRKDLSCRGMREEDQTDSEYGRSNSHEIHAGEKQGVVERQMEEVGRILIHPPHHFDALLSLIVFPQVRNVSMTGMEDLPRSVSEYSTLGGTVPNTLRFTKCSFSNS